MEPERFRQLTERYSDLRIALPGDFCLDRYLEIDPEKRELSIETGLPVHNVVNVRAQPGGAGTILNNLCALGIGSIYPIGFVGEDGDGFELWRALESLPGVRLGGMIRTRHRRTFTYCKPLVVADQKPPVELNRLDSKNWTPTPTLLQADLAERLIQLGEAVDGVIVLDQVDVPETGVVTMNVLAGLRTLAEQHRALPILVDSRRGLQGFQTVIFKMNAAELGVLTGAKGPLDLDGIKETAVALARRNGQQVFVTLAERGIVGASPEGEAEHVRAFPIRGEIDVVGAGDAVSANLVAALCAGAKLRETLELANAAASVVVHKLGTTGTATIPELSNLLFPAAP
ncbi:MAG TPA: PfkB family carbohydrate kinase [Verrucomicrobiae bacterium]